MILKLETKWLKMIKVISLLLLLQSLQLTDRELGCILKETEHLHLVALLKKIRAENILACFYSGLLFTK